MERIFINQNHFFNRPIDMQNIICAFSSNDNTVNNANDANVNVKNRL